jgi:FKBP-type peptidyl-prolyl cis-trans isomerase 2
MHNDPKPVVSAQSVVRLAVTLRGTCGEPLEADISELEVVIGYGQLLPKIEQSLMGLAIGEQRLLELQPEEAFGKHDASKVVEIDREEFPESVAPGDLYDTESSDGTMASLKVLEVHDDYVLVDMNHPLAGAPVAMQFRILAVRPADNRDIQAISIAREKSRLGSSEQLLPLNRLLKGHGRR